MNSDMIHFLWDQVVRGFENPDLLYSSGCFSAEKTKIKIIENVLGSKEIGEKLFLEQKQRIEQNVKLVRKENKFKPERITFHQRFGWTIWTQDIKAYLGKLVLIDDTQIEIGHRSYFSGPVKIRGGGKIKIGAFCCIAENISMYAGNDNHPQTFPALINFMNARFVEDNMSFEIQYGNELSAKRSNITIGDNVWIGRDCHLSGGITIGNGAIVGQKSFVLKDCDPYSIYAGSPAKKIRERISTESQRKLDQSKWWEWTDKEIQDNQSFFSSSLG